jgi:nucleoside-diphosphate-sugar epimerase
MHDPDALIVGFGDIGQRVAKLGLDAGFGMSALVRSPRLMVGLTAGVTAVAGDLDQAASLGVLADLSPHVVFHFAPPPGAGLHDVRTTHLLAALEGNPPQRMVYISTSGVYGDCSGAWVDETRPVNPGNARSRRRVDAEQQLSAFAARHSIPLVILRVPGIYGAGRYPLNRLQRGDSVICPDEAPWSNRIHADDLAVIAWRAAQDAAPLGVYNASDDEPSSMTDYIYRVADAVDLPRPPCVSLTEARQTFSPGILDYLNESRRLDNRRMKAELGVSLRYPTLAAGLASFSQDR